MPIHTPSAPRRLFLLATAFALLVSPVASRAADRAAELLRVHDWKTSVALGNRYLKQQALVATRDVLARIGREQDLGRAWRLGNSHYDAAERAVSADLLAAIPRDWSSMEWIAPEWAELVRSSLDASEVETLLAHFATEVGRKQARIIDHAVFFHVSGTYGFSGRLIQDFPGTEQEQKTLTYVWAEEDREMRFSVAASDNIEGQRFALSPLGAKYQKVLVIKLTGVLNARVDRLAAAMPGEARARAGLAAPFVAAFRSEAR